MKIAITGCIACGKTTFSRLLAENTGFKLISADDIVKNLYLKPEIIEQVQKIFENKIISSKNTPQKAEIDKNKLRELIFENPKKRKELENLIHPLVEKEIKKEISETQNIIAEIPLLFEAGFENYFDKIICLNTPKDIIIERLEKRGLSKQDAEKIINSQLDINIKISKSNIVIDTNSNLEKLKRTSKTIASELNRLMKT